MTLSSQISSTMGRSFGSLHRNVFMVAVMGVLWKCTVGESDVKALDPEKTGLAERSMSEVSMLQQKLDKLQKTADEQQALLLDILEEKEDQTELLQNLLKRRRRRRR